MTKMEVAYISKEGNCLQDVHIAAAGALLKSSFPERAGFQSTLYSPECWQSQGEETIQMHFDAKKQHWTTSTYSGNIICCFDSLYNGYLTDDIRQQLLLKLYGHLMKTPTVQVVRVQQQQGSTDCGLFAIAYAVHLAFNQDPQGQSLANLPCISTLSNASSSRKWNLSQLRRLWLVLLYQTLF